MLIFGNEKFQFWIHSAHSFWFSNQDTLTTHHNALYKIYPGQAVLINLI